MKKSGNHMMKKSSLIQFILSGAIIWTLGLSKIPDFETVKGN